MAIPILLDTDMGNDIDDALALIVLHQLANRREADLRAVVLSKDNPHAAAYTDAINHFYGRPDIPIGMVRQGVTPEPGRFARAVAEYRDSLGRPLYPRRPFENEPAPDAVDLLRRTLAAVDDGAAVVITIGFFTNLARLLDSPPDSHSPLAGKELVARKVKFVSSMAGNFSPEALARPEAKWKEYNVHTDIASAKAFIHACPVPVVFSGFEIGDAVRYPAASILRDFAWAPGHPVVDGYHLYAAMPYDRPCWDLTSALYAVRPERDYFGLSEPGTVTVDDEGVTHFAPGAEGRHRYLTVTASQAARLEGLFEALCSTPCR